MKLLSVCRRCDTVTQCHSVNGVWNIECAEINIIFNNEHIKETFKITGSEKTECKRISSASKRVDFFLVRSSHVTSVQIQMTL